jgi:DNA repair photolyase
MIYDFWIDQNLQIKVALTSQAEDCNEAGYHYIRSMEVETLSDLDGPIEMCQGAVDAALKMLNDNANQLKINTKITNGDIN